MTGGRGVFFEIRKVEQFNSHDIIFKKRFCLSSKKDMDELMEFLQQKADIDYHKENRKFLFGPEVEEEDSKDTINGND